MIQGSSKSEEGKLTLEGGVAPCEPKGRQTSLGMAPNALRVLEKRYLRKNEQGEVIESPEDLFRRVAGNIAEGDRSYNPQANVTVLEEVFYDMMSQFRFLPNSPTLMNAGRDLQQLSACFVLPIVDSMESIFETVKQAAIIHKTGGGTGFSFSRLRPKNDIVRTTGGVASGPVSFMKVFNHATEAVKQGGTRRGANMGILRVDHPDILDFISCKADTKEITNFNISVALTDRFMAAYEKGEDYALISPRDGSVVKEISATEVMDQIAEQAWKTGEPGLFFIDVTNRANPTPKVAEMEATNPCGEQPLLPYESCNLGSINLEAHLLEDNGRYEIDWCTLGKTIRTAVHFLDNVIDMNRYPIREIEMITKANRKIGLGVMGFSRMLYKLEVPYHTEEGIQMAREVMGFIQRVGYEASTQLAEERGVYANWEGSLHEHRDERVRNSYITTVAPTGTISMIADTSGGCEPEFSLIWYKNVMDGEHLPYVQDYFVEVAKREEFYSEDLLDKILANRGSVQGIAQVPEHWQKVFITSHGIAPEWHVRMQAAFQEFTDSAVSKTINLPTTATTEEIKKAYLLAYRLGCKGITVYRDGARPDQVMNVGKSKKVEEKAAVSAPPETKPEVNGNGNGNGDSPLSMIAPRPRPEVMTGTTTRKRTSCGDLYLTVNRDETEHPFEAFATMGKAGGCEGSFNEAIGRLISLCMRAGVTPRDIVKQLIGIRCNKPFGIGKEKVLSCSDAIAKIFNQDLGNKVAEARYPEGELNGTTNGSTTGATNGATNGAAQTAAVLEDPTTHIQKVIFPCPECGLELEFGEGCEKCHFCGYSRCY
ncbi:MAG: vitamin B12-dependent ribonucleotide reductase [Nitrospira sp.]|nr:vitamin B12-dependent ribonucleotide reductase [Candidatus Manganitrophaceae bacterium]HIL35376.1 vitamin B12-dependent ribonucleotide reductase [Candidatus Manganitrophaceae bacterium]